VTVAFLAGSGENFDSHAGPYPRARLLAVDKILKNFKKTIDKFL
jgi:hypothetical protein